MNYISLHTMTEYSFLESAIKIDDLIQFGIDQKLDALAITDRNNMYGVGEFVNKCKKNNIKPIIGVDLDVQEYRLIILAKNYQGYQSLIKLVSEKQKREIKLEEVNDQNFVIIDHPLDGYFIKTSRQLPWENYYIGTNELNNNGVYIFETRSILKDQESTLSILDSLRAGKDVKAKRSTQGYVLPMESTPTIQQAVEIAKTCNVEFPEYKDLLPKFKNDNEISSNAYLKQLINERAKVLLKDAKSKKTYVDRLKYEVSIIEKLKYEDYFLVIQDLISWAKSQGIAVGPGRGSAAGSLVSYVLGITEVDPIKYGLIFERFLNPERVTMPDIDIDIQDTRRDEVIKYLFDKYGQENTALISTFQKLGAKSSIRDVARLKGINNADATALTKLIPLNMSLEEAYTQSVRFRAAITKKEIYQEVFNLAKSIEGLPRQLGTHAAGIVLSSVPINTKVPTTTSSEHYNQVQYSMDYLEENGLLKIDLLGLRNLTIIQDIQREIYKNFKKKIDFTKLVPKDEKTNLLLSHGDTNGIFQFESYGMKKTLKNVGVSSFDDIVAILSLYRPGPMEFIDTYAARKKGKESIPQINKEFDKSVKSTFGIIVYQEQIMQIAQDFAGMSFGQADILRRAIGKKKIKLIDSLKKTFIDGAIKKGNSKDVAEKVYKQIESFANYGFNKSHAVAYAMLSYRLAFLKARFPFEFYTAIMQSSIGSLPALKSYINEAKKRNIEIVAPNINISTSDVENDDKKIVLPLSIIKGMGKVATSKIIAEREKGKFKDFFELVARLKLNGLGQSVVTSLIKANALRDFANMQSLLDSASAASRYADMIITTKEGVKVIDYDLIAKPRLFESKQDLKKEVLAEESIYGFTIEASLTKKYELETKLVDLSTKQNGAVVAMLDKWKKLKDKNGNEFGIATLSDSTNTIEVFVFAETYKFISTTKKGTLVHATINYNQLRDTYSLRGRWKEIDE